MFCQLFFFIRQNCPITKECISHRQYCHKAIHIPSVTDRGLHRRLPRTARTRGLVGIHRCNASIHPRYGGMKRRRRGRQGYPVGRHSPRIGRSQYGRRKISVRSVILETITLQRKGYSDKNRYITQFTHFFTNLQTTSSTRAQ